MYSLSASFAPSRRWIATNCVAGSRWKQMKKRPASSWPSALVDAVGERVAAAQDPVAAVAARRREPDVGVDRDRRRAVGLARRGRAGRTRRCRRAARRSSLCAADRLLLVVEAGAVPDLDQHPDPAGDQVVPPRIHGRSPRRRPRRSSASASASSARMLLVPSLKPIRLRGVVLRAAGRRGAAEAELRPAHHDDAAADPGQVADRVEGDLRVVGAGLDAEVAAAALRVELVAGQAAAGRRSAAGRSPPRPKPVARTASGRSRT